MSSPFVVRAGKALRMTPRQLAGRLRDEVREQSKRPWARFGSQLLRDRTLLGSSGATSIDALWERQARAPFFLNASDRARHVTDFRARYPESVAGILASADAALRHEFDLLGSGSVALGDRLPWLDDFKSGRHYPLQYCRDIQYMELDKPTDVKVPWELSRCQHFTVLGQAYWLSGDERYARELVAEIEDWIAANPLGNSVNWACAMDVALRAINWIWGFHFFADSQACAAPQFRRALLRQLFLHGEFVYRHLETGDVNGNHYLSDAAGLVFVGLFFRHTARGRQWLDLGRRIVIDEMFEQVSDDGVDFEQSTAYHRLVLELFATSYLLLEKSGETVPADAWTRLARMCDFVAAYSKPNGLAPLIGDADDGRVQKLGAQPINDHRYLLSTAAVRFGRGDFKAAAGRFWEESFWLTGPDGAASFDHLEPGIESATSTAFPSGGFYVLCGRSAHVVIDCGEVGMRGRGGHGHNDILGFELFMNGMNVVSDCGAYLYTASREWRNAFRSTAFHSVAQVDGEELNRFLEPNALWQLHYDAHPVDVRWEFGGAGSYFAGSHDGYARLSPPVTSRREVWVDPQRPRVAVRDQIGGDGARRVTWRFHLDPAVQAEIVDGDCRMRAAGREVWLQMVGQKPRPWRLEPGWVSPSYGVRHPTSVAVVEHEGALPATLACVFSDVRLTADECRQQNEQLDAHRVRVHQG